MYPYVDWPFVTNVTETVFIWDDFGHGIVIRFQGSAFSFLPRASSLEPEVRTHLKIVYMLLRKIRARN